MVSYFDEAAYESSLIELFENLDYRHVYAPDVERKLTNSPPARGVC